MALTTNLIVFSLIFLVVILGSSLFPIATASHEPKVGEEYTYIKGTSKGPENWGSIKPEWEVCNKGKFQSPIDINKVQDSPELGILNKEYKVAHGTLIHSGHDIKLKWIGDAGKLHINGTDYKFVQSHWHAPSEHTLNGTQFDLELHAVHSNAKGELAVIGVWYKIGNPDPFLSELLKVMESSGGKDMDIGIVNPNLMKFGSKKYYRYVGSLTTPPCSENVIWTIVKTVRTLSTKQLSALKEAVHPGFESNARPTQQLHGRQVLLYTDGNNTEESDGINKKKEL